MSGEGLFAGLFARGDASPQLSSRAFLQAMLDVEVALLRALVRGGLAPAEAADELVAVADADTLDLAALGSSTGEQGTPVPGMLAQLREHLSDQTAAHLHRGATSQDIVDTAMMLVARRALGPIVTDLENAAEAAAALAERHRQTVMVGRTLLQQALPLPFGVKAATWLVALGEARDELEAVRRRALTVQLGGAVGTLAAFGGGGPEIAFHLADELGFVEPVLPWHTTRQRPVALACALGLAAGTMGKIGRDVALLSQTEVAEAAEDGSRGRGGSSTMPHKRNPVGAIAVIACAQRTPGLVATMLGAMLQEHERAAGGWQAEGETLLELLGLVGSAACALVRVLERLAVNPSAMRSNLERTGGLVMSESVATALAPALGWQASQALVGQAAARAAQEDRPFRDALLDVPQVAERLGEDGVDAALDPRGYLGASDELIDRALAAHHDRADGRGERR